MGEELSKSKVSRGVATYDVPAEAFILAELAVGVVSDYYPRKDRIVVPLAHLLIGLDDKPVVDLEPPCELVPVGHFQVEDAHEVVYRVKIRVGTVLQDRIFEDVVHVQGVVLVLYRLFEGDLGSGIRTYV